ncbi:MAG: hypothetical protein ACTHJ5_02635 [Ilyomonas sp.]
MEIRELTAEEYKNIFPNPYQVFNRADFNSVTASNRNIQVEYLAFKTKKFRLGLIGGIIDNKFISPFSAPFGGFSYTNEDVSLELIDEAIDLFLNYCCANSISEVHITLPPLFYGESFISKLTNSLFRKGFFIGKVDLNYSIHLEKEAGSYTDSLHYNARKNLNIALAKDFNLRKCLTFSEKELAFEIIKENRKTKGYPLRMTFNDVSKTIEIIDADFFLVDFEKEVVAAAMVFHVAKGIVQVVYWGDLPEYGSNKTMNFLSYSIVEHYCSTQIKIVDIGPSTEDSIPNYGLCDFKESIGCKVFPKMSWAIEL